jgi:hypothetical protein
MTRKLKKLHIKEILFYNFNFYICYKMPFTDQYLSNVHNDSILPFAVGDREGRDNFIDVKAPSSAGAGALAVPTTIIATPVAAAANAVVSAGQGFVNGAIDGANLSINTFGPIAGGLASIVTVPVAAAAESLEYAVKGAVYGGINGGINAFDAIGNSFGKHSRKVKKGKHNKKGKHSKKGKHGKKGKHSKKGKQSKKDKRSKKGKHSRK